MAVIEAHELTKRYRIYRRPHHRLLERLGWGNRTYAEEVWALRNVDFSVPPGSTLGLIGENGAGKSTLLQIVAGTLQPSSGRLLVEGRLSAILDLGAGFHPEFTGRENVFMAGAILGFSPREMADRLDAIAAFAEIGDFLDRPIKTYSSGMFVRLAFSVATSVDPDILVIDEVLAVGDQYFQKKCIDRIDGFRKAGKTILFCSHSMYQVRFICDQVLWLKDGTTAALGETTKVVDAYESYQRERTESRPFRDRIATEVAAAGAFPYLTAVTIRAGDGSPKDSFQTGEPLAITVAYAVPAPPIPLHVAVRVFRNDGVECFSTATHVGGVVPLPTSGEIIFRLPSLALLPGEYALSVYLLDDTALHVYDQREREFRFTVQSPLRALGVVYLDHRWEIPSARLPGPSAARSVSLLGERRAAPLSVISVEPALGPWAELCQEALARHTPELLERVSLDATITVGEVLEKARGEFVALLHTAVAVGPGWATGLIRALETPGAGAAGPVAMGAGSGQHLDVAYQDIAGFLETAKRQAAHGEAARAVDALEPFCFMVSRALLARLTPSTPLLEAPSALRASGYALLSVPSVVVHTFTDYFSHGRPEILERIPPEARRILDVGCGAGVLGQRLKERRSVRVVGIEGDAAAAARARVVLDQVIECDLDRTVPELLPDSFDCLIFADVLEHLKDPWAVLRNLVPFLRPGGTVIACLPNVRHWSVLRGLLEGEWRYTPAGLLDQGHLRFFTRATGEELLTRAGLTVRSVDPLCGEAPGILERLAPILEVEGLRVKTLLDEARAVQFLFVAERPLDHRGG